MKKYLGKVRALLWERFQMSLRDRIEAQNGFEASIRSNPIELLSAIKRHTLDYEESRAWTPVVPGTFRECFNFTQEENDTSLGCTRRLRQLGKSYSRSVEVRFW